MRLLVREELPGCSWLECQLASQINAGFNHSVNPNGPEVSEVMFTSLQRLSRRRPGNRVMCAQTWGPTQAGCETGHAQTWMSGFWLVLSFNYQVWAPRPSVGRHQQGFSLGQLTVWRQLANFKGQLFKMLSTLFLETASLTGLNLINLIRLAE